MAFKFFSKKPSQDSSKLNDNSDQDYEFLKAIDLFTSQRERLDISLEELSTKTKISRNVLIAIEKGWRNIYQKKHI